MRSAIGIGVLASVLACTLDTSGAGGTGDPSVVTASTSGDPVDGSTTRGDTTAAASTGTVADDSTSAAASTTTATVGDTSEDTSSSTGGAVPEQCNGVDDDGDGIIDEPAPTNLACDDCTSLVIGGALFTTCTAEASWTDARARCMALGGDLASFTDATEQQAVVASASGDRWIGLSDRDREGTWTWADGSTPAYEDWRATEPDDWPPGEDCGQIRGGDGGWGDAVCESLRDYVCEVVVD